MQECPDTKCELPGPKDQNVSYKRISFHMVANDGNILEHSVPFDGTMDLDADGDLQDHNAVLPMQAIAERYDIIVDFAKYGLKDGSKLYFVQTMDQDTGVLAKRRVPLAGILSEKYKPVRKTNTPTHAAMDVG